MNFLKRFIKVTRKLNPSFTLSQKNSADYSASEHRLSTVLQENVKVIKNKLGHSADLAIREINEGKDESVVAAFIYIEGLADADTIYHLLYSIQGYLNEPVRNLPNLSPENFSKLIENMAIIAGDVLQIHNSDDLYSNVLLGKTVILINGISSGIAVNTEGGEHRSISAPITQTVIRGPQEGFTENIRINTAMVRRKIKDPNLWLDGLKIGRITKTDVSIMYIKGIVREEIVEEVQRRLKQIDIDGILESNYVEEFIQDATFTPFPTVFNTERPDVVAAALIEGRVAIFVDGTPFVLIVPALFTQFLQSAEDYYHRSDFGVIRLLRLLAIFISLLGPSLFIAISTFHQEMIPTPLLVNLAAQREGIPVPTFIEALMMEITFELLREASIRMPRAIGTSISIVGALVLGSSAVEAGLVSPAMVIVVSITAISGFTIPSFDFGISTRLLRFIMMGIAASFGFFGIIVALIGLVLHLCHLQSFGIPYMAPIAPFNAQDQKDTFIRLPWWKMITRPRSMHTDNEVRQSESMPKQHNRDPNPSDRQKDEGK
jgi:spore germination protein KA